MPRRFRPQTATSCSWRARRDTTTCSSPKLPISKVSKGGGGIGGLMKAASRVAGGNSGQDPTEAAVSIKLVQPDGKSRLTTTIKGKEDAGLDLKTGLGVAKF